MAVATAVSRITGFVRTLALVAALGLGTRLLDAYTAANVTPNSIYDLVMGGALASVLVPLLVRTVADDGTDSDLFAQRLLSLVCYGLAVIVIVTILVAPFIVDLYVTDFTAEQRNLAVVFTRYFLPQILFYGISATLAAVLNSRGRFTAPMWAPVANNLVVITTAAVFLLIGGTGDLTSLTHGQTLLLAIGTSAGVAAQMAVLAMASHKAGFKLRLHADPRGIGVRRITAMAGWTIASVAAAQLVFIVITRLASGAGQGAISVYSNAYTLFQLPYAVIAVTIITGVLPRLSRAAADRDLGQVTADLSQSLRLTGVVLVPVAAALIILGPRLTTVLFEHGNASPTAVRLTGAVLAAFGLALVPFAAYQIMLRVFYALGDTRTPALLGMGVSAVTIGSCLAASQLTHGPNLVIALAAGSTVAHTAGLLITAGLLRRRIGRIDGHRLLRAHARMLAAAAIAAPAAAATAWAIRTPTGTAWTDSLIAIAAAIAVGATLYALSARALRITEFTTLTTALRITRA